MGRRAGRRVGGHTGSRACQRAGGDASGRAGICERADRRACKRAGVILHLRGDLSGRLGKREELCRLVDFGLHGPGRQPAVERAL